jgi:exosortase/archaeosortase family protein
MRPAEHRRAALLPLLALAALWLPLFDRWRRAWAIAPDQAYGWAVPLLALYLVKERTVWAPTPRPPTEAERTGATFGLGAALLLYAAALPVLEANALWPTAQWAGAVAAAGATLAALTLAGGRRWAGHFAFPIGFLFTALTWPTPVKVWIVNHLVAANALLAAEIVSVLGHPAVVSGNAIAVGAGMIGVDEACSGLRSLQAVGMAALFLGEFFQLNLPRRLTLLGTSFFAAWGTNLARTAALTQIAAAHGIAASERWHDRAGVAELSLALGAVILLALRAGRESRPPPLAAGPRLPRLGGAGARPAWLAAAAVLIVALSAEAGTQAWYGEHERRAPGARWHWALHNPGAGWEPVPVPERAVEILQSSSADGLTARDPISGAQAWVFVVTWEGGAAQGENPEWHDPTICLPAAGAARLADWGTAPVTVNGVSLPFTGYAFTAGGRPLAVFFCHWDGELARARAEGDLDPQDLRGRRWRRVWEGRRQGDVAHLTLMLETGDRTAALNWLQTWAPRLLSEVPAPARGD